MTQTTYTFKVESVKASQEAESVIEEFTASGCDIEFDDDEVTDTNEVIFTVTITDPTTDDLKQKFRNSLANLTGVTLLE